MTIAEEASSSQPSTPVPGGGPRLDEPDLLAGLRARRVAEPGETALLRRAEAAEATVRALEAHVASLQQRLREAEGDGLTRAQELAGRLQRVEGALEEIRDSHRRMASTIGELKDVTVKLRGLADRAPAPRPAQPRSEEMVGALAAAVERLRARAQDMAGETVPAPPPVDAAAPVAPAPEPEPGPATEPSEPVDPPRPAGGPASRAKPHKHSMSLIGRLRAARKHRRQGR
jgi:hypothetical protein